MIQAKPDLTAAWPWFPEDDIATITTQIAETLRSGRLIFGPRLMALETEFALRSGVKHAVGVTSCSAALEIVYRHIGVAGREVIVPTNTFAATAAAVLAAGGMPVFCDMNAADFCLDVDDALSRVRPRTAAVVAVHVSGFVATGLARLAAECAARGIPLVEDCAHAHGARAHGRPVGSVGLAGCFSFYPTKILTCGVGGMLTTNDDDLAAFARSVRHHGQGATIEEIVRPGTDWVLDEVRAAVLHTQLGRLDEILARRRRLAAGYAELLMGDPRITLPRPDPGTEPVYYKLPILVPAGTDRAALRKRLQEEHGVQTGSVYWPPCHLMPVFRERLGTGPGMLPVSEEILSRQLTLPLHAGLNVGDVDRAVDALDEALRVHQPVS